MSFFRNNLRLIFLFRRNKPNYASPPGITSTNKNAGGEE